MFVLIFWDQSAQGLAEDYPTGIVGRGVQARVSHSQGLSLLSPVLLPSDLPNYVPAKGFWKSPGSLSASSDKRPTTLRGPDGDPRQAAQQKLPIKFHP